MSEYLFGCGSSIEEAFGHLKRNHVNFENVHNVFVGIEVGNEHLSAAKIDEALDYIQNPIGMLKTIILMCIFRVKMQFVCICF